MALLALGVSTAALGLASTEAPAIAQDSAQPRARWFGPDGTALPFVDDAAVLDFLASADIVERTTLGEGITRPQLVVLEHKGVRARAVFHDVDIVKDRRRLRSGDIVYFFRDSYKNNVAAYELGRLLGMANVPPAVVRRVGRAVGSIQLWIENASTETERRKRAPTTLSLEVRRRIRDMQAFDNLINNIDRNDGNMLHDAVGRFWLIDHTRAFSRSEVLPNPDKIVGCSRALFTAMRRLDEAETRALLAPWLSSFEIDALFRRREKVVELIERKIAENGEENVLFAYD